VLETCQSRDATSRVAPTRFKMQIRQKSLKVDQLWVSLDDSGSSVEGVFKLNTHYLFSVLDMYVSELCTCVATTRVKMQSRLESLKVDQLWMTLNDFGPSHQLKVFSKSTHTFFLVLETSELKAQLAQIVNRE